MPRDPQTALGVPTRRHRSRAGVAAVLAAVLGLAACGQQASTSVAADVAGGGTTDSSKAAPAPDTTDPRVVRLDPGAGKPRLRCPTDERSLMIADFAVGSRGAATPQRAVGLSRLEDGERMVVSPTGSRVWILRADGTAREEIHLMRMRGWLLHMRESCG
jgi:hypothetical protein